MSVTERRFAIDRVAASGYDSGVMPTYGPPSGGVKVPPERRFWFKAQRAGDCWVWTASLDDKGYGRFFLTHDKRMLAHRFAYQLMHGPLTSETVIRHSCDNPPCINPGHLLAGTQADNARDRETRGRSHTGSRHPRWHAFPPDETAAIRAGRAQGMPIHVIAAAHRTRKPIIKEILRGERA